jgi:hypothetical protein
MRAALLACNPIHEALWRSWHEAAFDASHVNQRGRVTRNQRPIATHTGG